VTTRRPRAGEKNGVDYHFVSRKRFEEMIRRGAFLEYEDNFGQLYGTPKKFIKNKLEKNIPVLLSIDVKGALNIRRSYPRNSVLIFILPPSIRALKKRLKYRKSDGPEAISKRLGLAKKEMSHKDRYDYIIVNDRVDRAYRRLKKIVLTELSRGR
jgi:guanylate kinase